MKFLLILLFGSTFALGGDDKIVQVQGNCKLKVVPDRGTVSFTAENQFKNQKEAVKKTNQQINSLKERIQKLKLKDVELRNTQYTVQPIREYEKERMVDKGIRASLTLEVTTSDIARIGEAMVEASKVGITNVGSLMTSLSLEKTQQEYLKCLDVASDDARKKAQQLGKKLGFKLGDVVKVVENPSVGEPGPIYPVRSMMAKEMDMAATSIEPGTQDFNTTLEVHFAIK